MPHDKVSIQLYTLRIAAATPAPTRSSPSATSRCSGRRPLRLPAGRAGRPLRPDRGRSAHDARRPRPAGLVEPRRDQRRHRRRAHQVPERRRRSGQEYINVPVPQLHEPRGVAALGRPDERRGRHRRRATGSATATTTTRTSSRSTSAAASRRGRSSWIASTPSSCTSRSTSTGPSPAGVNTGHTTADSALQFAKDVVNDGPDAGAGSTTSRTARAWARHRPRPTCATSGSGSSTSPSSSATTEVEEYIVENDTPDNACGAVAHAPRWVTSTSSTSSSDPRADWVTRRR